MPPFLLLAAALCAGCANPGPPKPPSLHLPQVVKDLSAERVGDHVLLRWTTPSRTTDDAEIRGAATAELCRETEPAPSNPAARLTACVPVRRLPVLPGPSEVIDSLPPALQSDPAELLTYRIQVFNSTGHSAGESAPAYAASGQAPPPVLSLQASSAQQGAVIEWPIATPPGSPSTGLIDFKRIDLSTASPAGKGPSPMGPSQSKNPSKKTRPTPSKKAAEKSSSELHLRAAGTPSGSKGDIAGTIDTTAAMGDTYTYTAQRIRPVQIGTRLLEIGSQPSAPVTLALKDTFAPKVPSGLATISGGLPLADAAAPAAYYIDLSWEPNGESDLAGYRVYRQLARPDGSPQGPLARLTAVPISVPAFRDVAVKPGQGYIYSVTAVDAAGNESAPSAKATEFVSEVASPGTAQPPH